MCLGAGTLRTQGHPNYKDDKLRALAAYELDIIL